MIETSSFASVNGKEKSSLSYLCLSAVCDKGEVLPFFACFAHYERRWRRRGFHVLTFLSPLLGDCTSSRHCLHCLTCVNLREVLDSVVVSSADRGPRLF